MGRETGARHLPRVAFSPQPSMPQVVLMYGSRAMNCRAPTPRAVVTHGYSPDHEEHGGEEQQARYPPIGGRCARGG